MFKTSRAKTSQVAMRLRFPDDEKRFLRCPVEERGNVILGENRRKEERFAAYSSRPLHVVIEIVNKG